MTIATAVVNWNTPDIPEVFPWIPYTDALDHMVEAGYDATEWGPSMPTDPTELGEALGSRGLDLVGAFVGLGFRDADKLEPELERALGIARFLVANRGTVLIAAEAGDDRRRAEAGHVDESRGLTDEQWRNLGDGLWARRCGARSRSPRSSPRRSASSTCGARSTSRSSWASCAGSTPAMCAPRP
jgi:inosose dehydratase